MDKNVMKMEWGKMMSSMNKLYQMKNNMEKGMDEATLKSMAGIDMEWEKMMGAAKKMQDMTI